MLLLCVGFIGGGLVFSGGFERVNSTLPHVEPETE